MVAIDSTPTISIFRKKLRFFGSEEAANLETSQIGVFWQKKGVLVDRYLESMASQIFVLNS